MQFMYILFPVLQKLPEHFHNMYKDLISNKVSLKGKKQVQRCVRYDKKCRRLLDVGVFKSLVNLKWYNPLILTYVCDDCFEVQKFRSCGVVADDLLNSNTILYKANTMKLTTYETENTEEEPIDINMIQNNRELAIFKINV